MFYVGLDDTDTLDTRGTGHMARQIAAELGGEYAILGVTRHQLWRDAQVPCTKNNSSAAILVESNDQVDLEVVLERVQRLMLDRFVPGSDPGLCVTQRVPDAVIAFGRRTQREWVTQNEARALAKAYGIALAGLGGDESGVIGALAAVGLAASGEDGRYVWVGRVRELSGLQTPQALVEAGVAAVQTPDGQPVIRDLVLTDRLRPARRRGRPLAIVEWDGACWLPLKLD